MLTHTVPPPTAAQRDPTLNHVVASFLTKQRSCVWSMLYSHFLYKTVFFKYFLQLVFSITYIEEEIEVTYTFTFRMSSRNRGQNSSQFHTTHETLIKKVAVLIWYFIHYLIFNSFTCSSNIKQKSSEKLDV